MKTIHTLALVAILATATTLVAQETTPMSRKSSAARAPAIRIIRLL